MRAWEQIWARCSEVTRLAWLDAEKTRPTEIGVGWPARQIAVEKMQQAHREAEAACRELACTDCRARRTMFGRWVKAVGLVTTIKIPADACAWQLYTAMPGAEFAAAQLTAALKSALQVESRAEAIRIMSAALTAAEAFGAGDSESVRVAEACLHAGRGGASYNWLL